jgi:hypothetical protein
VTSVSMPLHMSLLNAKVLYAHFTHYVIGSNLSIKACDFANSHRNFPPSPIFGILCTGTSFEFFSFDGTTSPPTISRGILHTHTPNGFEPHTILSLADYRGTSGINFICSLRPICEVLFYLLLQGYKTAVGTYAQCSIDGGNNKNCPQNSTLGWNEAHILAIQTITHAKHAAAKAAVCDGDADEETKLSLKYLDQRFLASCFHFSLQN